MSGRNRWRRDNANASLHASHANRFHSFTGGFSSGSDAVLTFRRAMQWIGQPSSSQDRDAARDASIRLAIGVKQDGK
jgi:hypothetical protein